MATNMKKSLMTYPFVLISFLGTLLIGSCQGPQPGKDQVCISVPNDTSELGRKDHFIPVMSIDIYKRDFEAERDSLGMRCPNIFIPNSETFNKASIVEFFKDTTVVGLKFYYGIKPGSGKKKDLRLMIVDVNAAGKNVYLKRKNASLAAQAGDDDGGLEYGQCSPPCTVEP
jgi:hypothetical protein